MQLIYGGRDDEAYFDDIWLLDLASKKWQLIKPAGPLAPPGRDHHSAAFYNGKLFIYGAPASDGGLWGGILDSERWLLLRLGRAAAGEQGAACSDHRPLAPPA